ncbi:flavoprotein [Embleya sp. NPDC059237]|uniref:flavoprotein n=1 Tax=Embleya sp. NPDC059237 TaxID=3346784 RepID=UPI003687E9C2
MTTPGTPRVLYVIACAAPPARDVAVLVRLAQERGWEVCVITTPNARAFVDAPALEELTGHPVRSEYKRPGDADVLPAPTAIAVAPATVNTVIKWALGIADTLALGLLTEAIGKQLPVVAMPFTNRAQAAHPKFGRSIEELREWGVRVLYGPDVYELHEPGAGGDHVDAYPWHLLLPALEQTSRTSR